MLNMDCTSKVDIFIKVLKKLLFIATIIVAIFYSKDTFIKFQEQATSFKAIKKNSSELGIMPAIVICFQPTAKPSALKEHKLELDDFIQEVQPKTATGSWETFRSEGFYELNRDILIKSGYKILNEGKNDVINNTVTLTKVMTLFAGLCYKLSFESFQKKPRTITVEYLKETLSQNNSGYPNLYITSEESAYGILDVKWTNGEELKLNVPINQGYSGSGNLFKLKPKQIK